MMRAIQVHAPYLRCGNGETPLMNARTHRIDEAATYSVRARMARAGLALTGVIAAVTTLLSAATVWLVLTRPLAVANAIEDGRITVVAQALADLLVSVFRGLASYL
jgi:hypothetical protein